MTQKAAPPKHAWSSATLDSDKTDLTRVVDEASTTTSSAAALFLPVEEAERLVESLECVGVAGVGSKAYLKYFNNLQTLNLSAHSHAQSKTDEYILEAVSTFEKLPVVIENMLAVEAWRTRVLPSLKPKGLAANNCMRSYFTLYSEGVAVNLLELALYHRHQLAECSETLDLVDYVVRQITGLCVPLAQNEMLKHCKKPLSAAEQGELIMNRSKEDELKDHEFQIRFSASLSCLTLLRYFTEHFEALPLHAQTRLLDTHDVLVLIVPLVENPPWSRRNGDDWEKWEEGKWGKVEKGDLLKLSKIEGQVWLAVYHLTCTQACREKYPLSEFRKSQILRLRKYLNDIIVDQLPVLADVRRYLDELALMSVPGVNAPAPMLEVAPLKSKIDRECTASVADEQWEEVWSKLTDKDDEDIRALTDVYSQDGIEEVFGEKPVFELNGLPVREVQVTFPGGECAFEIKPKDLKKGVESETERGTFKRYKLSLKSKLEATLDSSCDITATVSFESDINHTCTVASPLELPDSGDKTWHQIGAVTEMCVVQLGLEKMGAGGAWSISKGFISLPVNNIS